MEVTMTSVVATAPAAAQAGTAARFRPTRVDFKNFKPQHFLWQVDGSVATITLNRPERKNPLTLESYSELRDTFRDLVYADNIKTVVITGAGGNFCSGGDVHEIIGPLVEMQRKGDMAGLLAFTRMTGDLVKAMRACPQPIVAAVDGICAGAGAILAMASDLRYGTERSKVAFLFVRVGLAEGPTFGHAMTKRCIHQEWSMGIDDAIEAEAQAQAICMQTKDYERAYEAFVAKAKPVFKGN